MPSILCRMERVGSFNLEKNSRNMTEDYNITNVAENVIRKGLGSVFHNPVELLGLKQIKLPFLYSA